MKILKRSKKNNAGTVLVLSLWILTLLSLMASSLAFRAMLQMKVTRRHIEIVEGRYLAQGAVFWAMHILSKEDKLPYQALNQRWATDPGNFEERPLGQGKFSVSYPWKDSELGLVQRFGIIDEERKININTAPKEILMQLPEVTEEIVDAIIDWRDTNTAPERRGAEKDYYQDLDPPYPAKDGPFESVEELLLVREVTPNLLSQWKDLLTIYGNGKVNINTASLEVLHTLGLEDDLIEKIDEFRQGLDQHWGTEDDGVFKEEGSIARTLFEYEPLNAQDVSKLVNLVSKGLLGVQSKFFMIPVSGLPSGTHETFKLEGIVEHLEGDEIKIHKWVEQ